MYGFLLNENGGTRLNNLGGHSRYFIFPGLLWKGGKDGIGIQSTTVAEAGELENYSNNPAQRAMLRSRDDVCGFMLFIGVPQDDNGQNKMQISSFSSPTQGARLIGRVSDVNFFMDNGSSNRDVNFIGEYDNAAEQNDKIAFVCSFVYARNFHGYYHNYYKGKWRYYYERRLQNPTGADPTQLRYSGAEEGKLGLAWYFWKRHIPEEQMRLLIYNPYQFVR
jgi:hypothetical protein